MEEDVKIIKDKIRNRILELLSASADDEEIRKEVEIMGIDISTGDIHRIRVQWNKKMAADREMVGSIEEGDAPVMSDQEMMEANRRWNQMMVYWGCRGAYHRREKVRIANVIYAYRNQQRKGQAPI